LLTGPKQDTGSSHIPERRVYPFGQSSIKCKYSVSALGSQRTGTATTCMNFERLTMHSLY